MLLDQLRAALALPHKLALVQIQRLVKAQARLLQAEPAVYYVTAHYLKHPVVLVRLGEITRSKLRELLKGAWHGMHPGGMAENRIRGLAPGRSAGRRAGRPRVAKGPG